MTNREQIRAERIAFLKDFLKNSVFGLILIFIAFGLLAAGNVLNGRWMASVDTKMAEANDLASQVAKTRAQIQAIDENQKYAITGVDLDRKAADDQIFQEFLDLYANWSSFADLAEKGSAMREQYQALGSFGYFVTPGTDERGNVIGENNNTLVKGAADKVVSQHIVDVQTFVRSVSADTYAYYGLITYDRTLGDTVVRTGGKVLVEYKITSAGQISGGSYYQVVV